MSKREALAKFLDVDVEDIQESQYDNSIFEVNPRKVKEGHAPSYYIESIKEFKKLLNNEDIIKINNYLALGLDNRRDRTARDKLYYSIEPKIENKPVIKGWLYNQNILYWLLETNPSYENSHEKCKKAWFGQEIKDDREIVIRNSGEYMVLTDSEADEKWEEYLENYIDDCILPEVPESARFYFDREKWKDDARIDGRGHCLSSYNGCEECIEFDGEDYYIYRIN